MIKYCKVCNEQIVDVFFGDVCGRECKQEWEVLKRIKKQAIAEFKKNGKNIITDNNKEIINDYSRILSSIYERIYDIKCCMCGNIFRTNIENAKYCSKKCTAIASKIRSRKIQKQTDFLIFERDNFKCIYCGKSSIYDGIKLHVEHIYPISRGGGNELFNLATSCEQCNAQKSNIILSDKNILDLWLEVDKRNNKSGKNHYDNLIKKLNSVVENRRRKLYKKP